MVSYSDLFEKKRPVSPTNFSDILCKFLFFSFDSSLPKNF